MASSLWVPDGIHLNGTNWEDFKLGLKGDEGGNEPSHGKVWDGIAILEGQGASRGLQNPPPPSTAKGTRSRGHIPSLM